MGSCVSKRFAQVDDKDTDHDGLGMGLMSGLRREDSVRSDSGAGKMAFDYGDLLATIDSHSDDDDDGLAGLSVSRKKDPF